MTEMSQNISTNEKISSHQKLEIQHPNADTCIEMLHVAALVPYTNNARTHSKKQVRQIAKSIRKFGFTNPVLIDDGNMILAGHGRVQAALLIGLETIPCVRLSSMTAAEKRAYVLADNKLAENAGWDEDLLADELSLVLDDSENIDIDLTGFTISEIDTLIDPGGTAAQADLEREDSLPEVDQAQTPVTQKGDLWIMGNHRLLCGDARNLEDYNQLFCGIRSGEVLDNPLNELADMIFTDPPYNVWTCHVLIPHPVLV